MTYALFTPGFFQIPRRVVDLIVKFAGSSRVHIVNINHKTAHNSYQMSISDKSEAGTGFPLRQKIVWEPDPRWIRESNLQKFMEHRGIQSLGELQNRSVSEPEWFWHEVLVDLEIEFATPYSKVLDITNGIQNPIWCVDGKMNIVHNCLDKWQNSNISDATAFVWESETGHREELTYRELHDRVCQCANALRQLGLGKGDSIGLFMPMTTDLVVAFLAIAKIGAIILPLFSGYGPEAIATRLNDGGAIAVFTSDGFLRRTKVIRLKEVLDEALLQCPEVKTVIVTSLVHEETTEMKPDRDIFWNDVVPDQPVVSATEMTSAEDIVMIIYTSGTTGQPKGAVHTHCGFPVKAAQDMRHAMDLKRGEMMYWMTDMGWMMGPWLVFGTLLNGAAMLFYDGAPDYPDVGKLWRLVDENNVTHLGLSPVLIRALKPHGTDPVKTADLSQLRAVCSTGSPWDPESWLWVFDHVLGRRKPIFNYSGGTEISGGIICGNFFTPMKPCSFSGPVPGMAADVVDEDGNSVQGAVGELVIRAPWIGMTRGFWKDHERYIQTYWSRYRDVWVHGDFAAIDSDGLWYILGRSDDTIKVAGKRLGPAEAEAIINKHDAVRESAAIGAPHDIKGEELVIFCVIESTGAETETLRAELKQLIVDGLGKPMKPGAILFTNALPKTRNSKVIRRLIRSVHLDAPTGDTSGLADFSTLSAIRDAR